ncbi:MAG: hypothetical protein AAFR15_01600 [Cyanobacteria bacterium J06627_15]
MHPNSMHIADPDAINVAMSFPYHGLRVQITTSQDNGLTVYSAWVDHATGSAVAVPMAYSRNEAITRAKTWVRRNFVV